MTSNGFAFCMLNLQIKHAGSHLTIESLVNDQQFCFLLKASSRFFLTTLAHAYQLLFNEQCQQFDVSNHGCFSIHYKKIAESNDANEKH
jgi:hypothetical protein